jgi:hypothetical protein
LPHRIDQLVLADDPVTMANEMNQQIEDLRLDVNDLAGAPQFLPRDIDLEIGEAKTQGGSLVVAADRSSLAVPRLVK